MNDLTPWYRQKTVITAVLAMLTAGGAYLAQEIDIKTFIEALFAGAMVIFMRFGVEKSK